MIKRTTVPGSTHHRRRGLRYHLSGLDYALAVQLESALQVQGCRQAESAPAADIVFCPPNSEILRPVLRLAGGRPVIAVSRLPETALWLDALEAGATDYYAPPFEDHHINWMLDRHCRRRSAAA